MGRQRMEGGRVTVRAWAKERAKLLKEREDALWADNHVCQLCGERQAAHGHHIIPRARTSKRHPVAWLNDRRNVIFICTECHTDDLHTRGGIMRCVARMQEIYPDWEYKALPWGAYV